MCTDKKKSYLKERVNRHVHVLHNDYHKNITQQFFVFFFFGYFWNRTFLCGIATHKKVDAHP